jgi:hypothetical protein
MSLPGSAAVLSNDLLCVRHPDARPASSPLRAREKLLVGDALDVIAQNLRRQLMRANPLPRRERHGKPAGVLIGFESEEDWFEYRLQRDPRFLQRIEAARRSLAAGGGTPLEEIEDV